MNNKPIILDVAEKHLEEILKLNQDLVHFLSDLDMGSLTELGNMAEMFKVVEVDGKVAAFLIAVRENKPYASVNYKWFLDNYDKFLYVDRVVVSEDYQHMGIGRLIYNEVFNHAKSTGVDRVTAEIDIKPPNPVSLKFHEAFGFKEVGKQMVSGGKKEVSLQSVQL